MLRRYFFDSSAFIGILRREPGWERYADLLVHLRPSQKVTSVLVAYELHRGTPDGASRHTVLIGEWLSKFTVKPVTMAHAMSGAQIFRQRKSKGRADPIIAAQAVEGGFPLVTTNRRDFERVPGLELADL